MLYRTLQEHWSTFLADLEAGGGELPAFVLDEVEAYLRRGIPVHGFLRARCKDCGHSRVVAFSCKRRGFCPSCMPDGGLLFHPLPAPSDEDVARVARSMCLRARAGRNRPTPRLPRAAPGKYWRRCRSRDHGQAVRGRRGFQRACKRVHLGLPSEAPRRTPARPPPQAELAGLSDDIDVDYAAPSNPEW